jgi:intein/homing endonuclease
MPNKKLKINNKPLYTAAASVYPYSKVLELHFLVQPKFKEDEAVFLAKKSGDYLLVPRELAPVGEDRRSRGKTVKIGLKVQPRDEKQVALISNSLGLLQAGQSHTLQALMGFGKSYCGTNLIVQVGLTALIIVTKEDLMIQWRDNLLKYTDIKEDEIGIIQQNKCEYTGKKICIGMVHSLAGTEYPSDMYDYFGLVVCDECVTGDAAITLSDGSNISLETLVSGFEKGLSYSVISRNTETNTFEPKEVTKVWRKGTKKVLRLSLDDGSFLKCTEDHLLLTSNRGWVMAKDLTISDDVVTINKP